MIFQKTVNYLECCGVEDDGVVYVKPHQHYDGKEHTQNSHGLCPDCMILTYYLFRVEEYLSREEKSRLETMLSTDYFSWLRR